MALLNFEHVSKSFGKLAALREVSFEVESGSIAALIGPNGAGKSTAFNAITGLYVPDSGTIHFDGKRIDRLPTYRIAARGIARTFQNIRLFSFAPAIDNVLAGAHAHLRATMWDDLVHSPRQSREEAAAREVALRELDFVDLMSAAHTFAGSLPYGSQRRLEIARALASSPKLLLLDEPAAGMNPSEKQDLIRLIRAIGKRGVTVLLIEHDMGVVMQVADRITVLDYGERIAQGSPAEIRTNDRVIQAYLGMSA